MKAGATKRVSLEANLKVEVLDLQRRRATRARVEVTSERKEKVPARLDAASGVFEATLSAPGVYTIRVSLKDHEAQTRKVRLSSGERGETFVLGKKGLPFYYRGRVKVPFEPLPGLIAVTTTRRLDARDSDDLLKLAEGLHLKAEERSPALRHENTWLFKGPDDREAQERVLSALAGHRLVRRAGPVLAREGDRVLSLTPELIVKLHPDVTREALERIAAKHGLVVVRALRPAGNAFLLRWGRPPTLALLDLCDALARRVEAVEYAEPNLAVTAEDFAVNPTDFLYSEQWHIPVVQLPDAWQTLRDISVDRTFGDPSVIVAVFDRGIQSQTLGGSTAPAHPDFQGTLTDGGDKVYRLYDFDTMQPNNDNPPNDHGMGCSGVSVARADNAAGVAGVNEGVAGVAGNCRAMGVIRPAGGTEVQYSDAFLWMAGFEPGWVADGVDYPVGTLFPAAPSPGADIITNSYSWSSWPISGLMSDTIDHLTTYGRGGKGALLFFASGNGNTQLTLQAGLAAHPKTFAIGASSLANDGVTETFGTYSNTGQPLGSASGVLDVCAPSHDAYIGGNIVHNPPASYGVISADLLTGGNMPGSPEAESTLSADVAAGATTLAVASTVDFEPGHAVLIGDPGGAQTEATLITSVPDATHLNVSALMRDHGAGDPVRGAAANYKNNFGGTSSATPLSAGIAALVLSANPSLTWVEVREILRGTAVKIDPASTNAVNRWVDVSGNNSSAPGYAGPLYSQRYGYGRVDAAAAVAAAAGYDFQRDIHVRDDLADDGLGPSAGAFWGGVDIWVRNANDNVAPAGYAAHADTVHQPPIYGQSNWVYVRFRNIGALPSHPFYVRVYLAHWPGTEFVYPDDFIPSVRPSDPLPDPLVRGTYLIGEAMVTSLGAGSEGVVGVEWPSALVPPHEVTVGGVTVTWHPCLLVEVTPHDGFTPTGSHVWENNNLAQKNLSIVYPDDTSGDFAFAGVIGNVKARSKFTGLTIGVKWPIPRSTPVQVRFLNRHVEAYLLEQLKRSKRRDLKAERTEQGVVFHVLGKRPVKLRLPNVGLCPFILRGNVKGVSRKARVAVQVLQYDDGGRPSGGLAFDVVGKGR